jgi:DNA-binding PadR family transcriptional regulator
VSSINLTLLGLAIPEPISAYDMAKFVETHSLTDLIRLSIPAIYKNIKKLEQQGYLASTTVRYGVMPEKTLYSVTEQGKKLFYELMGKYVNEDIRYHFEFNPVIVNLDKLPKKRGHELALQLKAKIEKRRSELKRGAEALRSVSRTGAALLSEAEHVTDALLDWIDELIGNMK